MNSKSFDYKRIAEGYAKDRPFLHGQVMELVKKDLQLKGSFERGLDVGCGAGLSTKALKMLCDQVTGTDISAEMIEAAKALYQPPAYTFYQSGAEEIKEPCSSFDIVTAAGVTGWIEEERFLRNLRPMMKDGGVLLIYDFWITDKMKGSTGYTDWWHNSYLRDFPKPPRKENIWGGDFTAPFGFELKRRRDYCMEYGFDKDAFVRFMMLQSNVNAQIDEKGRNQEEIRNWFLDTLDPIFENEGKVLIFEGYYWYFLAKTEWNHRKSKKDKMNR